MSAQPEQTPEEMDLRAELDRRFEELAKEFLRERTRDLSVPEQLEVERNFERGREIARRNLENALAES